MLAYRFRFYLNKEEEEKRDRNASIHILNRGIEKVRSELTLVDRWSLPYRVMRACRLNESRSSVRWGGAVHVLIK